MEVTLSRKWAKSRTRGLKRHLTGAKACVGRARQTRADLEEQLKACRREIAQTRERLIEVMTPLSARSKHKPHGRKTSCVPLSITHRYSFGPTCPTDIAISSISVG
jgi:septal ring factor EnvC (AmiA/AmiB activator)